MGLSLSQHCDTMFVWVRPKLKHYRRKQNQLACCRMNAIGHHNASFAWLAAEPMVVHHQLARASGMTWCAFGVLKRSPMKGTATM